MDLSCIAAAHSVLNLVKRADCFSSALTLPLCILALKSWSCSTLNSFYTAQFALLIIIHYLFSLRTECLPIGHFKVYLKADRYIAYN